MERETYICASGDRTRMRVSGITVPGGTTTAHLMIDADGCGFLLNLEGIKALRKQLKKIIKEIEHG